MGRQATLASSAYERVRRDIIAGALSPGLRLRMSEMCLRYKVGLSPMREALSRLGNEGLVVQSDRRGFSVAKVSEEELLELVRTRCLVYEVALREAIRRGDEEWAEAVVVAFHRLDRASRNETMPNENDDWEGFHRAYHSALIAACGSRQLIAFSEQLFDQAERYRSLSRTAAPRRDVQGEHRAIMEAAIARRTDEAISLLSLHVTRTGSIYLGD